MDGSADGRENANQGITMALPSEIFVRAATTLIRRQSTVDRRLEPRVYLRGKMAISLLTPAAADEKLEVVVHNLSPGGLGMVHRGSFKDGEQFIAHLPDGDEKSDPALYTVTFCRPTSGEKFIVGARFERMMEQA
jgi:hypothetical protein